MGRFKATPAGNVPFTLAEEAEADADIAGQLAKDKAKFIKQVDKDADAIIADVIGNRGSEYERAESEATTFAAGGYAGVAPPSVQSWATAKAWTTTQAANDIIAAATAWRTAQAALRADRLLAKESARNAVDGAALDTVKAPWAGFVTALRVQLGV